MFRTLASLIANPTLATPAAVQDANLVFTIHPIQLSRWLEQVWAGGGVVNWPAVGGPRPVVNPDIIARLALPPNLRNGQLQSGIRPPAPPGPPPMPPPIPLPPDFTTAPPPALGLDIAPLPWEHLIYAYLIEATGVVEILGEVARRYLSGETLPTPDPPTLAWVRATEELFFRDPPLFHISGVTSQLRPDARVNRRNAFWRMFGCDLPHGITGVEGQPWKLDTGPSNTRFRELWNELLRQVWVGIENDRNAVGANPTDANYVGYLCQTLGELFQLRRRGGMLAREEYVFVCFLSYFHLTVEFDTAVVNTLGAGAGIAGGNPADRLAMIGAKVGITPPREARELFELADLLSPLFWLIEMGQFNNPANAALLFRSFGAPNAPIPTIMTRIIDLWQSATGEPIKDLAVAVRRPLAERPIAQPTRLPSGPVPASPNGRVPARS